MRVEGMAGATSEKDKRRTIVEPLMEVVDGAHTTELKHLTATEREQTDWVR